MINNGIKLKQLVFLFVNKGFKKCEIWEEREYLQTHFGTHKWRSHIIASRKIDLLHKIGLSYTNAQKFVIMEGRQKVNKDNLALLGSLIWIGSIDELSNQRNLWDKNVTDFHIKGIFRNKIEILVKKESE